MLKSLIALFAASALALAASGAAAETDALDIKVISEATSDVNLSTRAGDIPVVKTKPGWVSTVRITDKHGSPAEIIEIATSGGTSFEVGAGSDKASFNVQTKLTGARTTLTSS